MHSARRAMTVLELLVVIAIIGVLIGIVVPAVQKVREMAARTECANNMRQVGTALHAFHNVKGGFPPAVWNVKKPNAPKKNKLVKKRKGNNPNQVAVHWVPYILPYIEQENLFKEYNFDTLWSAPANVEAVKTPIPLLLCPAAPAVDRTAAQGRATMDYSATCDVRRPNPFFAPLPAKDKTFIGVLGKNVNRKLDEITDGTSNTFLIAEDAGRPQEWTMGQMAVQKTPGAAWSNPQNNIKIEGFSPATMTTPGTCAVNCYNKWEIYSFHPGGANVVFADGSVHFLSAAADMGFVIALLTRGGGETVAVEEYAP